MTIVKIAFTSLIFSSLMVLSGILLVAQQKKEYLSPMEVDKVRAAEGLGERIKLFTSFADDRLKKFQYTASRTAQDNGRVGQMKSLIEQYTNCIAEAEEYVEIARDQNQDIKQGLKEMDTKTKAFLVSLDAFMKMDFEPLSKLDREDLRNMLRDAIEETSAARELIGKAEKENLGPPVRRKP